MKLRAFLGVWALAALLSVAVSAQSNPSVTAPGISSAGSIPYPINSASPGMVTLQLSLDSTGSVTNAQPVRDYPPFTAVVQSAVQGWSFSPASSAGNAIASNIRVNAVFNPFNPGGVALPAESLANLSNPDPSNSGFSPASVNGAVYANYPVNSVSSGTVVLDVTIGKSGGVKKVKALQTVPGLTSNSITAVKNWSFSAATYKGQPIVSHVVVAFVFQSPAVQTR